MLKCSKIVLIFKSKNKKLPDCYSSIAIFSPVSKIFKYAIKTRLVDYFTENSYFCSEQHGFTAGKSTQTAISNIMTHVLNALNRNNAVAIASCDLSKAFNLVDHIAKTGNVWYTRQAIRAF